MIVRRAAPGDCAAVIALAERLIAEQSIFRPSPPRAARNMALAVNDGRCFVAQADGTLIGLGAYSVCDGQWYSDEPVAVDMGLYVLPDHRKSRAALLLRNALKTETKDKGLRFFPSVMGRSLAGTRLYAHGFSCVGQIFEAR